MKGDIHGGECSQATPARQEKSSSREGSLHVSIPGMDTPILAQADFQADAGFRLRRLIDMLGITQVEAARLMGVSKHVLRNWLAGAHPIGTYALYRLCRAKSLDFNFVYLGDWTHLPYHMAKEFEQEMTAKLAASSARACQEPEKTGG